MGRFSGLIKIFSIFLICVGFYSISPSSSFSAQPGKIVDYNYLTHYSPGETVRFSASVKNTGSVFDDYYIQVVLTNHATGKEFAPYPTSGDGTINAGETALLTTGLPAPVPGALFVAPVDWAAISGLYTVTILLYNSISTEVNRVYGTEPVHVGTTVDSVAAFPNLIDLGTLQYGRYMHPVPIEISWDFYLRSSQVRKDHPWYMRIYTDNHKKYRGLDDAIYSGRIAIQEGGSASAAGSPAGLVSSDGKYAIPLKVWCLNFGPDVEEGWTQAFWGRRPSKRIITGKARSWTPEKGIIRGLPGNGYPITLI